jgi:hypothetical protein
MESWSGTHWSRVEIPRATEPVLPEGSTWLETDPALLGVSCTALVGCTAVGAQAAGATNSEPLAQSEAGAPAAPPQPAGAPVPVPGRSADVKPVSGTVSVELPGTQTFLPLSAVTSVPMGVAIDATHGRVKITTTGPHGGTQTGEFFEGEFVLTQPHNGLVVATLSGGDFSACPTALERSHVARTSSTHSGKHVVRKLWTNAHGSFSTKGNYAAATVRGTEWLTEDLCEGTLIRVTRDRVAVRNLVNHRQVTVRAGHSYLAKAP